ncbi:glycosyltransferase family 4 protein [Hutsoniella sourekii]|uniref:glycosyltransferase family 4 protein n=1 Tax=Hutsoniella sourekii TaxID=87650 RepID=UPI000487CAE2|nr:glycosyltransferase family 4 protein [Hutsoniella sourekii]
MKKALIYASVASMIDLFNMDNINILQNLGYEVDVACNFEEGSITSDERVMEFKKELEILDVKYYHIPIPRSISRFRDIIDSYEQTKSLTRKNYDIVHCHSPIGSVICRLAFKDTNTKVIYTAHGFHFFKGAPLKNWILYYPIERLFAKYTDLLITINDEDYQFAKKKLSNVTDVEKINGIGIDIMKFSKKSLMTRMFLRNYRIYETDCVIISVGQLSSRKNHSSIINAIHRLNNPHLKYLIIGEGELRSKLETLIKELNLEEQVFLLGYRENIAEYLSVSDIFAFPSLQEGLPVALMEAMAVGLPCIVSNIRGNSDLIDQSKGGFISKDNTGDQYMMYLNQLSSDKQLREQMGIYNQDKVRKFDKSVVNKQMKNIYSEI